MNTYSKICEGLGAWMTFELRCGREEVFSEAYMANPLHQLLSARFPGRILAQVEHPVLGPAHGRAGRKPCVDFAVSGDRNRFSVFIETKWVSKSKTLLQDTVSDIVRLDMLTPAFADEAILILAGRVRDINALFRASQFQSHPDNPTSRPMLPLGSHTKASVRFAPVPEFRRRLYTQALRPFKGHVVSRSIPLERSGPFPRGATTQHVYVYLWRLRKYGDRETFRPEDLYGV